jgi:LPS O-antigen subunit length determinant protein (WzzB/FepE family)
VATTPGQRLERLLRYKAVLACAAVAVPATAAAVAVFEPPRWLSALLVGLPAVVALASLTVQWRQDAENERQAQEEEREAWKAVLRQWPVRPMREQDPYRIGVYASQRALRHKGDADRPPYVRPRSTGGSVSCWPTSVLASSW